MTVVVKNEQSKPYVFEGSAGKRQIAAGEVQVVSDDEWGSVISALRGPGKLNPLWPNEVTSDTESLKFDHYLVGAEFEVRYIGISVQGSLTNEPKWTIKRFEHTTITGENFVTGIQVLHSAAWDDRASLPWV